MTMARIWGLHRCDLFQCLLFQGFATRSFSPQRATNSNLVAFNKGQALVFAEMSKKWKASSAGQLAEKEVTVSSPQRVSNEMNKEKKEKQIQAMCEARISAKEKTQLAATTLHNGFLRFIRWD